MFELFADPLLHLPTLSQLLFLRRIRVLKFIDSPLEPLLLVVYAWNCWQRIRSERHMYQLFKLGIAFQLIS